MPPPGRRWGQNRGGRQHPTKLSKDKEYPSLEALIKITHAPEEGTEKKQSSDVLLGFPVCFLHPGRAAWSISFLDQQVTSQMFQGSKQIRSAEHKP